MSPVIIEFEDHEFQALADVLTHAERVAWTSYDAAKQRILAHVRQYHPAPDEETPS